MMRRFAPVILVVAVGLVLGCGKKKTEQESVSAIQQSETKEDFAQTTQLLEEFTNEFPQSEKAPEMLNKLAVLYATGEEKNFSKAIDIYRKIIEDYPNSKQVAQSQFMIGYVYANELKDYDSARAEYNKFLEKYPDHELVSSVKWELDNLGKDPSEIEIFNKIEDQVAKDQKGSAGK